MSLRGGTTKQSKIEYFVYMMASTNNRVIYIGVTNNLVRRVYEHRNKFIDGFTNKYNVIKLVYFESCPDINSAIAREKQLKGGSRRKKIDLITRNNPNFEDFYHKILG